MKRALSLLLCTLLLCAAVPLQANAYAHSGKLGSLSWSLNSSTGRLTISGSGRMVPEEITNGRCYYPWSGDYYVMMIRTIEIKEGVTDVGDEAFYGFEYLEWVSFPKTLSRIGKRAFACCGLKDEDFPSTVHLIDEEAYLGCIWLKHVKFGYQGGALSIGDRAFQHCQELAIIEMRDETKHIGKEVFSDTAYYDKSSNWSNGALYMGSYLESYLIAVNDSAENITLRSNTSTIADDAFSPQSKLTSISFLGFVANFDIAQFRNCKHLRSFNVHEVNPTFSSDANGVLFNKDQSKLLCYPVGKQDTAYQIPESVTQIGDSAFSGSALRSVNVPDSVTKIGNEAFRNCSSLQSIMLADRTMQIGNNAFAGTSYFNNNRNWTDASLYIGHHLICSRSQAETVTVPQGMMDIATSAFATGTALRHLVLPDSIGFIGEGAFEKCGQLTSVCYSGTGEQWNAITVSGKNNSLLSANIYYHRHTDELDTFIQNSKVPTCTQTGYTGDTYFSPCGVQKAKGEIISALGHDYSADHDVIATCTQVGYTVFACSRCSATENRNFTSANGHVFGEWMQITAPTEYTQGQEERICAVCGSRETRSIATLPYTVLTLNKTSLSLNYKESEILTASEPVTWMSTNEGVVKVDANGNLTTVGKGTTTVIANSVQGGKTAMCTVTVKYTFWQTLIRIFLFGWIWY